MSRTTVVLLVLAGLLTAEVILFEQGPGLGERIGKAFPSLDVDQIVEISIAYPAAAAEGAPGVDTRPIVLVREGQPEAWWIAQPIHFPAFHPRAMGIAYELVDLVRVAEASAGANVFPKGVEIAVRFRTRSGEEGSVDVGMDYPGLDFCYVRAKGEVFVTKAEVRRTMTATLQELRSRALFPIALPDATRLAVRGPPESSKVIERDGQRWRLRAPIDALADREHVEELLKDLNSWTVTTFERDDASKPEDLEPFGLATPVASVSLSSVAGRSVTLEIGSTFKQGEKSMVHVRHAGAPFVFGAAGDLVDRVLAAAEAYRSRFVFDVGLEDITEVAIEGGGNAARLKLLPPPPTREVGAGKREEPEAGPSWEVTDVATGVRFPGDVDRIQVTVADLRQLLIHKFVDAGTDVTGLEAPWGRVDLLTSDGKKLEFRIGKACPDADYVGLRYVSVPGEPGSYLVDVGLVEKIAEGPLAFRDRKISLLDSRELLEMEIRVGRDSWFLARVPDEPWTLSLDTPFMAGKEIDQRLVDRLVLALDRRQFTVEKFLPDVTDYGSHGVEIMDPRRALILLRPDDLRGFRKLVLGDVLPGSSPAVVVARVDPAPDVPPFTLLEDDVPKLFDALVANLREVTGK